MERIIRYLESMPLEINNMKFIDYPVMIIFYNSHIINNNYDITLSELINKDYFICKNIEIVNKHRNSRYYDITVPFGKMLTIYYNNMETKIYPEGFYKINKLESNFKYDYTIKDNDNIIFCILFGTRCDIIDKRIHDFLEIIVSKK